jgi:hypothetical protein
MSTPETPPTRRAWLPAVLAAVLTLTYLLALTLDVSPLLRGPVDWRWPLWTPQSPEQIWIPVAVIAALVAFIVWVDRWLSARPNSHLVWIALCGIVMAAPALQVSLLAAKYHDPLQELFDQTITPYDAGFFSVVAGVDDLNSFLHHYPDVVRQMPDQIGFRPRTHPPGAMAVMWLGGWLLDRVPALATPIVDQLRLYRCEDPALTEFTNSQFTRAVVQMALPLLSGLTVLPLFALGRRLWGTRVAFLAAAAYPLLPAVNAWPTFWDALYPLAMCLALLSVEVGLARRRPIVFLVGGLAISLASWFSFGNLLMAAIAVLYGVVRTLMSHEKTPSAWPTAMAGIAWLALGTVAVWLVYWIGWRVNGWQVYQMALIAHREMYRPYWTYLLYNLYDFWLFAGLPVAVCFLAQSATGVRAWLSRAGVDRNSSAQRALILTWLAILVGLDLVGITRGEVGRLWMFLMPVALLIGVGMVAAWRTPALFAWLFTGTLGAQTLVMSLVLLTAPTDLREPIRHTPSFALPPVQHATQARLDGRIDLSGYDLQRDAVGPGEPLEVTLYWKSVAPSHLQYTVFAHLLDAGGALRAQYDAMPRGGALPTSCWRVGEAISDTLAIPLPADAPPGVYTLQVGMYYVPTGQRLPVSTPGGTTDHITLQSVQVKPKP